MINHKLLKERLRLPPMRMHQARAGKDGKSVVRRGIIQPGRGIHLDIGRLAIRGKPA